jgi:hypothetical protein
MAIAQTKRIERPLSRRVLPDGTLFLLFRREVDALEFLKKSVFPSNLPFSGA